MKKYLAVSLLASSVLFATAQASAATEQFKTEAQKQAYAVGASMARYLDKSLQKQEKIGVKLDRNLIIEGMKDGLHGKSKLSDKEVRTVLTDMSKDLAAKAKKKEADEAAKAKVEGAKFLKENAKKPGVKTTQSGLQYKVLKKGTGPQPTANDIVTVNYKGSLVDGTVFDSSAKHHRPATFKLNQVIPGWTEGVQLMHQGGKYRFYIPAKLAYGDHATGSIPGNSTLIFDVDLLKVKTSANSKSDSSTK